MKKIALSVATLALSLSVVGCGTSQPTDSKTAKPADQTKPADQKTENKAAAGDAKVIKLGHVVALEHPYQKGAEKFKEIVEAKSHGSLKVEIYANSQLGSETQLVEGMQLNTIQAAIIGGTMGVVEPKFFVLDLPYLFSTPQQAYKALDGELGNKLFDLLSAKKLKGLAYWENGFRDITTSTKPIKTPDDLKGLKIRVPESKAYLSTFKSFGANPTPMSFDQLFNALQQHVVDGQENPIANIHSGKFNEVQKYLSLTGHMYGPAPLIMSLDFWNSLTDDQKKIVQDAANEARDYERKVNQDNEAKNLDDLKAKGMQVTEVDKKLFKEKTKPVYAEFEPIVGKDMIDLAQKQ